MIEEKSFGRLRVAGYESPVRQDDFPPVDGSVADGADVLRDSDIADEIARLVAQGALPAVYTDDTLHEGTTALDQFYNFLLANGYGNEDTPDPKDIEPNTVACQVDYADGEAHCIAGDDLEKISVDDLSQAEQILVEYVKNGDPTTGFEKALEYLSQQLANDEVAENEAVAQEDIADLTSLNQSSENLLVEAQEEDYKPGVVASDQVEQSPKSFEYTGETLIGFVLIMLALMAYLAETKWRRPKRDSLKSLENLKDNMDLQISDLQRLTGIDAIPKVFESLESILENDYPDQALEIVEAGNEFADQVIRVLELSDNLDEDKIGYLVKAGKLTVLRKAYINLQTQVQNLFDENKKRTNQFLQLKEKQDKAQDNLSAARAKLDEKTQWYETQKEDCDVLPLSQLAFGVISEDLEKADRFINQENKMIRGGDIAEAVLELLEMFSSAVIVLVEQHRRSQILLINFEGNLNKWQSEVVTPEQILTSGNKLIGLAVASLSDDSDFTDVHSYAQQASVEFSQADKFVTKLYSALQKRDENKKEIKSITDKGFVNKVQDLQAEVVTNIQEASNAVNGGNWLVAFDHIDVVVSVSNQALEKMKSLRTLRDRNNRDLNRLATTVAKVDKQRTSEVQEAWEKLQTYNEGNYVGLTNNFDSATQTIQELFDQPNNQNDLASQAEKLNGMDQQNFDQAEVIINTMERKLANAQLLMDKLIARCDLVVSAEKDHQRAIDQADLRVSEAKIARDVKDAHVDEIVDQKITNAEQQLSTAREQSNDGLFIDSLSSAQSASKIAIEAKVDAGKQIKRMEILFSNLEREKTNTSLSIKDKETEVETESDTVVTQKTYNLLRQVNQSYDEVASLEVRFTTYEDNKLAQEIERLTQSFNQIVVSDLAAVNQSLENDRNNHKTELRRANSAIDKASQDIRRAASSCRDSRAGSAGDATLRSAESLLPNEPEWGSTKSEINRIIREAKDAENRADKARSQALSAIAAYEAEEKRKAAIKAKKETEKKRKEEIARAKKAAEKAKKDALAAAKKEQTRRKEARQQKARQKQATARRKSSDRGKAGRGAKF